MATRWGSAAKEIHLDIARVLLGLSGEQSASMRTPSAPQTTVGRATELNGYVRQQAEKLGLEWQDEFTWLIFQQVIRAPNVTDKYVCAARILMGWTEDSKHRTKTIRRKMFFEELGYPKRDVSGMRIDDEKGAVDTHFREAIARIEALLLPAVQAEALGRWCEKPSDLSEQVREKAKRKNTQVVVPVIEAKERTAAPFESPDSDPAFLEVQRAFRRFSEILDDHSDHYPSHLVPSRLAEALSLSPTPERPARHEMREGEHYMDQRTYGGRPVLEVLTEHRRLVLLGNPGGGKTTALTAGVLDRLKQGIPSIFVRLSQLARENKYKPRTLSEALEQVTAVALADAGVGIGDTYSDISVALETDPRTLIALDGLDEVQDGDLDRIHALLRMLNDFNGTLVVSSRWAGYQKLRDDWQEFCVDNLRQEEASKFFELWFDSDDPEGLARAQAVLSTPSKAGLCEIPVLLGIVAAVAGEGSVPEAEAHLYARYVSLFLEGKWKPWSARVSGTVRDQHLQAARSLAWAMATGMTGLADGTRWESVVTRTSAREYLRAAKDSDLDMDVLMQLIRGHGLLVPIGRSVPEDHQKHGWLHRTVHEHLVGGYLLMRFRAGEATLGLPVEVFAGATQWREPLRHFFGLLHEHQQTAIMETLEAWRAEGDPGWVFIDQMDDLVLELPAGHRLRVEAAHRRTSTVQNFYQAAHLDAEVGKENLIGLLARNDAYDEAVYCSHDNLATLPEAGLRETVAALRAVSAPDPMLVKKIAEWYSKWDCDDALRLFVESGINPYTYSSFPYWKSRPTECGVAEILETIAAMDSPRQVRWLQFLLDMGVNLSPHVQPAGPLTQMDVDAAEAFLAAPEGPWDASIRQVVLAGTYGDEPVFEYAALLDADGSEPLGEVALLAKETLALRVGSSQDTSDAPLGEHLESLRAVCPDDLLDVATARRLIAAATAVLKRSDKVSTGWCLQVHWALGICEDNPDDHYHGKKQYREVLQIITSVILRVLEEHTEGLVDEILLTDPRAWVSRPPSYGYFEILKHLRNKDLLTKSQIVDLIVWAGDADIQTLHYLRLGSDGPDIAKQVWENSPRAVAANSYQFSRQLAEAGVYIAWRERIMSAVDEIGAGTSY